MSVPTLSMIVVMWCSTAVRSWSSFWWNSAAGQGAGGQQAGLVVTQVAAVGMGVSVDDGHSDTPLAEYGVKRDACGFRGV